MSGNKQYVEIGLILCKIVDNIYCNTSPDLIIQKIEIFCKILLWYYSVSV